MADRFYLECRVRESWVAYLVTGVCAFNVLVVLSAVPLRLRLGGTRWLCLCLRDCQK